MRLPLSVALVTTLLVPPGAAHAQNPAAAQGAAEDSLRALLVAAHSGDTARVRRLLAAGVSPNAALSSARPMTPLHVAARAGDPAVVEMLLRAGANAAASDHAGATPLHYAAESGAAGSADLMRLLLASGASARARNHEYVTPLHVAARAGRRDIVELLIARRADIEVADTEGKTPAGYALEAGHQDLAFYLITGLPERPALDPRVVATTTLLPEDRGDLQWHAQSVVPLAFRDGRWLVGIGSAPSGIDDALEQCDYRPPWGGDATHGRLQLRHWSVAGGAQVVTDSTDLGTLMVDGTQSCTPGPEIERRYAEATRGLPIEPEVWRLAAAPTFASQGRRFRTTLERAAVNGRERTLACFSWDGSNGERCLAVITAPGDRYMDRVTPTAVVVRDDGLWVFGLRTSGQRVAYPEWHVRARSVAAVLLGRVPLER